MDPDASTRVLVLRHGQSEWNALGRWQGHADIALDAVGRQQAQDAAAHLAAMGGFSAVWSSDLQRARATADVIASALCIAEVHADARLREYDVGPWEGLDQHTVEHQWPGYLAARKRPEGFESPDAASARMLAALRDIGSRHVGESVVVVSHGGVTRATRRALGAVDQHLPNLGGTWFTVENGSVAAGELVTLEAADGDGRRAQSAEVL